MSNWYVIQTKPKKEKIAVISLEQKSIKVFYPKIETVSIVFGKYKKCLTSLFPNYIFAYFEANEKYKDVRWSNGVYQVVGFNGRPIPIHNKVIEIIKSRVDDNGCVQRTFHFRSNDRIRIRSGPLKDLMGIFDRWIPQENRVRVLISLLNYDVKIDIHHSQLVKVA